MVRMRDIITTSTRRSIPTSTLKAKSIMKSRRSILRATITSMGIITIILTEMTNILSTKDIPILARILKVPLQAMERNLKMNPRPTKNEIFHDLVQIITKYFVHSIVFFAKQDYLFLF